MDLPKIESEVNMFVRLVNTVVDGVKAVISLFRKKK